MQSALYHWVKNSKFLVFEKKKEKYITLVHINEIGN